MKTNRARRQFLSQTAAWAGTLTLAASGLGKRSAHALDNLQKRRHLIVVQPPGPCGYDSHSFHSALNPAFMGTTITNPIVDGGNEDDQTPNTAWTPRDLSVTVGAATTTATGFQHPNYADGTAWMGAGMDIFKNSGLLENDIAIWNGAGWDDGGHTVGTIVLNCGMSSRYANCFSALVAQKLGLDYARPLHYVQLAAAGGLDTHTNLVTGLASPINVPDFATFKAMTLPSATEPSIARTEVLGRMLDELMKVTATSSLKLKSSKGVYDTFLSSFHGASFIRHSNWGATNGAFDLLRAQYATELAAVMAAHPYGIRYKQKSAGVDFNVSDLAFRFALAEFLIVNDYAAVVDLPGSFGDFHNQNYRDAAGMLATYAAFKKLISSLKSKPHPDGSGRSLLDITTLAMFTEFDRQPALSWNGAESNKTIPGADHGRAASVVLAGAGVAGGRVIGGLKHAVGQGPGAGYKRDGVNETPIAMPIPVDRITGRPSPTGDILLIESMFPTMMEIFGVSIPAQQLTNHQSIRALKKG